MNQNIKKIIFLLRISLGWIFFYSAIIKIMDPGWSAAGYLSSAKTLSDLYQWFAGPQNIAWINFLNKWGQLLIGVSLISGFLVRFSSYWGILLMLLYYLPVLNFPYVGKTGLLVDEHIIYILLFVLFIKTNAGKFWGGDNYCKGRLDSASIKKSGEVF